MTADERIENLLNAFGQTISDLPKDYTVENRILAKTSVLNWSAHPELMSIVSIDANYICHLADVIDRMEIALETALRAATCDTCQFNSEYGVYCDEEEESHYRINDKWLTDEDEDEDEPETAADDSWFD